MASPKQIKCPECNAILKIDDAHYASIINQVRDQLFEDQLNKRVKSEVDNAVKINEHQLKISHQKAIHLKDNKIKEYEEKQISFKREKEISLATQKLELKNYYQEPHMRG